MLKYPADQRYLHTNEACHEDHIAHEPLSAM